MRLRLNSVTAAMALFATGSLVVLTTAPGALPAGAAMRAHNDY